jgi:hypothetical protein
MALIKPKFIAIDSSVLGKWAADVYSNDPHTRKMAGNVLDHILSENWIPVICWHHIEELIRHPDEAIVEDRMKFLFALPHVAWIWTANGSDFIGSVVDVQAAEIQVHFSAEYDSVKKRRLATRNLLLRFGKLSEIPTLGHWRDLRQYAIGMGKDQQKIASICHGKSNVNDNTPLSALKGKKTLSYEEAKQACQEEATKITQELIDQGDKRLSEHEAVAQDFSDKIFSLLTGKSKDGRSAFEALFEQFGYKSSEFPEYVTLGEFKDAVVRREQLGTSIQQLGRKFESVWPKLRNYRLPSEEVISSIRSSRRNAIRASGSDLNDDYLASLMPYLDAVVVDKRTYEYLIQAKKRNPQISTLIGSMVKVSSYNQLPSVLNGR